MTTKIKKCVGKEGFQRMNYLLQLGNAHVQENSCRGNYLATLYSSLMTSVAKKTVQRIEPSIKRIICKRCKTILVAGITCKVRINKKHVRWCCNLCNTAKVFKTNNNHTLWTDQPESIVETLNYSENTNNK